MLFSSQRMPEILYQHVDNCYLLAVRYPQQLVGLPPEGMHVMDGDLTDNTDECTEPDLS